MEITDTGTCYDIFQMRKDVTINRVTELGKEIRNFISAHPGKSLVFDLSITENIDSSGLSLLINIDKNLRTAGRKCFLLSPSVTAMEILEKTRLNQVIPVIASCDDIVSPAKQENIHARYFQYTRADQDMRRLLCTCPVCSSPHCIGYLLDSSHYDWRWDGEFILPQSFVRGTGAAFDFYGHQPIVCMECFMCSAEPGNFVFTADGKTVMDSSLDLRTRAVLARTVKKRRQIMDIGKIIGDVFFETPRSVEACHQAYLLIGECQRTVTARSSGPCPYTLGKAYYHAFASAGFAGREEAMNNARAWLSRALQEKASYSRLQLAQASFMLVNVDIACGKTKDASAVHAEMKMIVAGQPSSATINDAGFWYDGACSAVGAAGI